MPTDPSTGLNPFPGLRPFQREEDYLFFGREDQVAELMGRLHKHRFVAVVGTSGSGKSSLVRCGLLSELEGGRLAAAGSRWEIAVMQPGGDPITRLSEALLHAGLYPKEDADALPRIQATLRRSRHGLIEAARQAPLESGSNLLLVVDQFEEIFRFHETGHEGHEEAPDFIRLLLEAAQNRAVPIYIVITMRSDFIGDCARFSGLAEAVNQGEYLIPRLTRDQTQSAIEGPVRVAGGAISRRLIQRLLNDVEQDLDHLPVLQHCLMRMWDYWRARHGPGEPLDLVDYIGIGGMDEALSRHADEVLGTLAEAEDPLVAEKIFKALTERGQDGRGIRRPQRVEDLVAITGTSEPRVIPVIEAFRKSGVTFLVPMPSVALLSGTVVDISHESLMRVWSRLRAWVEEEEQSAAIYRRLTETASLWEKGRAGLYHDPDLQIASTWREEAQPNAAWAKQYGGGFEAAMRFLDESRERATAEEREREEARQRELRRAQALAEAERGQAEMRRRAAQRLKVLAGGLAVVVVLALAAWRTAIHARQEAQAQAQRAEAKEAEATQLASQLKSTLTESDFSLALEKHKNGLAAESVSYLARALRTDPNFWRAGARALSTIASGVFPPQDLLELRTERVTSDIHWNEAESLLMTVDVQSNNWANAQTVVWDARTGRKLYELEPGTEVIDPDWTDDGKYLFGFLPKEGMIRSWHPRSGLEAGSIRAPDLQSGLFKFTTDTARGPHVLASYPDGAIQVFHALNGQSITPKLTTGSGARPEEYGFTSSGRRVYAYRQDGSIGVWETASGRPIASWSVGQGQIGELSFTASDEFASVRSADGQRIAWWRLDPEASPSNPEWITLDEGAIRSDRFLPGNSQVAILIVQTNVTGADSNKHVVAVYDLPTRQRVRTIEIGSPLSWGWMVESDANDTLRCALMYTIEADRILIWELTTGQKLLERIVASVPRFVFFSPDGTRVATYLGGRDELVVWDLTTGTRAFSMPINSDAAGFILGFYTDGQQLLSWDSTSGRLQLWDGWTGRRLMDAGWMNDFNSFRMSSRLERFIALVKSETESGSRTYQSEGFTRVVDTGIRPMIAEPLIVGHTEIPTAARYTPDGRNIVVVGRPRPGDSQHVLVWNAASRRLEHSWSLLPAGVWVALGGISQFLSPDGRKACILGSDQKARVLDLATGAILQEWNHNYELSYTAWSPDSTQVATGTRNGKVRLWNVATGAPLFDPVSHGDRTITKFVFSPNGRLLVSTSTDWRLRLMDARTGELVWDPMELENEPEKPSFSPDGLYLAVVPFAREVRVVEVASGKVISRLTHPSVARGATFSPDGTILAVAIGDHPERDEGAVFLWDWRHGRQIGQPLNTQGPAELTEFNQDGTILVSSTIRENGGAVQIWDVASGQPLTEPVKGNNWITTVDMNPAGTEVVAAWWNGEVRVIEIPPRDTPVPEWLPRLAESAAGERRLSGQGGTEVVSRQEKLELRQTIHRDAATSPQDRYAQWGLWLSNPDRPPTISPGSTMTYEEYAVRMRQSIQLSDLRQLMLLNPNDSQTLGQLALLLQNQSVDPGPFQAARQALLNQTAVWTSSQAAKLASSSSDAWGLHAEVLSKAGRNREAELARAKSLELDLDPARAEAGSATASYLKAVQLATQGQWRGADQSFAHALDWLSVPTNIARVASGEFLPRGPLKFLLPYRPPSNLKNLRLPDPIPATFENFDSAPEGALPPGWTAHDQSDSALGPLQVGDLSEVRSDAFKGWTTVAFDRLVDAPWRTVDGGDLAADSQGRDYGVRLNSRIPFPLMQGRFALALARNRAGFQAQYLVSPVWDCRGKSGVHLAFHSVYRQLHHSVAAVEYSIDGGTRWLPVSYLLDKGDLSRAGSDQIDVVDAFTREQDRLPAFHDGQGRVRAGTYGDFLGAPIDAALIDHVEGLVEGEERAGLQVFRLKQADNQAGVRLRFAFLGMNSLCWLVDEIGLYELNEASPIVETPEFLCDASDPARLADLGLKLIQDIQIVPGIRDLPHYDSILRLDSALTLRPLLHNASGTDSLVGAGLQDVQACLLLGRANQLAPNDPWIGLVSAIGQGRVGRVEEGFASAHSAMARTASGRLWIRPYILLLLDRGDALSQTADTMSAALCYQTAQTLSDLFLGMTFDRGDRGLQALGFIVKETPLLPRGSEWRYFHRPGGPGPGWKTPEFNDRAWDSGHAPLGYGEPRPTTRIESGATGNRVLSTAYFRTDFEVEPGSLFKQLNLRVRRDDGIVIYLNGQELARDNMPPGEIDNNTFSLETVSNDDESRFFDFLVPAGFLREGRNVLATEVHQRDLNSSDLLFDFEITGRSGVKPIASPEALDTMEKSLGLPERIRAALWLARARQHRERDNGLDQAAQAIEYAARLAPASAPVLFEQALLLQARGEHEAAYEKFCQSVDSAIGLKAGPPDFDRLLLPKPLATIEPLIEVSALGLAAASVRIEAGASPILDMPRRWLLRCSRDLDSRDPQTRLAQVEALIHFGELDQALAETDAALDLSSTSDVYAPLAIRHRKDWLKLRERVLRALGRDQEAQAAYAELIRTPVRRPGTSPKLIDLSPHYNVSLYDGPVLEARYRARTLAMLPESWRPIHGVDFDLRGMIQLLSGPMSVASPDRNGKTFNEYFQLAQPLPDAVRGIAVHQLAAKIHLLAGCREGRASKGEEVARIVVHFEGGEQSEWPLKFREDIADWEYRDSEALPFKRIAWRGRPTQPGGYRDICLALVVWDNPFPDKQISHLDFVSAKRNAAPFLVAITLE